jgi:electron-transferring-flavoprotein dehydrogenase
MVRDWHPDDWNRTFGAVSSMMDDGRYRPTKAVTAGATGLRLLAEYYGRKLFLRGGRYCQLRESDYTL